MAHGRLGTAVGGGIAADHVGRTAAEEVCDIELAGVVGDGASRERVAESVGVHLGDPGLTAERPEAHLEFVIPEADAGV